MVRNYKSLNREMKGGTVGKPYSNLNSSRRKHGASVDLCFPLTIGSSTQIT